MNIHVSKGLERLVHDSVQIGHYASADDVVNDALARLREAMSENVVSPLQRTKSAEPSTQNKPLSAMPQPPARLTARMRMVTVVGLAGALVLFALWALTRGPDLRYYQAAVDEIRRFPDMTEAWERKYDCHIEPGPPLRVVFVQPAGVLDNWVGIVYDPTGIVINARQFKDDWSNWNDPALKEVRQMFGGDLRG